MFVIVDMLVMVEMIVMFVMIEAFHVVHVCVFVSNLLGLCACLCFDCLCVCASTRFLRCAVPCRGHCIESKNAVLCALYFLGA